MNDYSYSRDTRLCQLCSFNVVEIEAHILLECPLYNLNIDKFPSLFENVVPRSLKSFFQLDHQVYIEPLSQGGYHTLPI